jgi:GTP-binding protein
VLTLVDVPGYGHAVADQAARTEWNQMTREYLRSRRLIIARCCVLVDCTRGLCREDRDFIRSVYKVGG